MVTLMKSSIVLLSSALCATAAAGPLGNPAGMSPDTPGIEAGKPVDDHANAQDRLFVRQASLGGRAEVELSTMAQKQGASEDVRAFARRMVDDHRKSNDRLMRLGKGLKAEAPGELDPEHRLIRDDLQKLSGADRDLRYIAAQIADHQKTVNLLQWHLSYGQNAELLRYSGETLPVVMNHLEHARDLHAKLVAGASQ